MSKVYIQSNINDKVDSGNVVETKNNSANSNINNKIITVAKWPLVIIAEVIYLEILLISISIK